MAHASRAWAVGRTLKSAVVIGTEQGFTFILAPRNQTPVIQESLVEKSTLGIEEQGVERSIGSSDIRRVVRDNPLFTTNVSTP